MIRTLRPVFGSLGILLPVMAPLYLLLPAALATLGASVMLTCAYRVLTGRVTLVLHHGLVLVCLVGAMAVVSLPFNLPVAGLLLIWSLALGWGWLSLMDLADELPQQEAGTTDRTQEGDWNSTPVSFPAAQSQL